MSLNTTPSANRLHIGIFGKRNSGKSSLVNALTGQNIALVSPIAGTTTDPVYKAMEIHGIGPVVFIDTAGYDDQGSLGELRVEKTRQAIEKTDIALLLFEDDDMEYETAWLKTLRAAQIPVIGIINKCDLLENPEQIIRRAEMRSQITPLVVSAKERKGLEPIIAALIQNLPPDYDEETLTGPFVKDGELVLLVMPQDIQAPKGRLILPQVQTIRDLLDKKCIVISVTTDKLKDSLSSLVREPDLIITDSQVFPYVYENKPAKTRLTSFSILFAAYKGDLDYYKQSAKTINQLTAKSRILIAEACTHAPLSEDIGREKIPRMLKKLAGDGLTVEIVSGPDFPDDLTKYDLVIQCGACMFNRRHVLARIEKAKKQQVPMTNYGIVIAFLTGILDQVS